MRVTNSTVARKYLLHLERNYSNKYNSENKIASTREFSRASQNPVNAAKGLKVRKTLSDLEGYEKNLKTAKSIYENAESALMGISSTIQEIYGQLIYAANGTQSPTEDEILASSIETFADEMVRLMNVEVADRTIYGGTNNYSTPFRIVDDIAGKHVEYNGVPINKYQDPTLFPDSGTSYADIGIGLSFTEDGRVDEQTALPVTFNGALYTGCGYQSKITSIDLESMSGEYCFEVAYGKEKKNITLDLSGSPEDIAQDMTNAFYEAFGAGSVTVSEKGIVTGGDKTKGLTLTNYKPAPGVTDENYENYEQADITETPSGYAGNIMQLTLDAATAVRSGDKTEMARYADAIYAAQTNVSLAIADIGNQEKFIDFNMERITNNKYTATEMNQDLEGVDLQKEPTTMMLLEAVYNATLQMSGTVIPMSIFNFIK